MYAPHEETIARFVIESNAIEGYSLDTLPNYESSPYHVNHLQAAHLVLEYVREHCLPDVRAVHSVLMRDLPDLNADHVGTWRRYAVVVGDVTTPKPYLVPRLVETWENACADTVRKVAALPGRHRMDVCAQYHYWFECIHPFADGNGRSGRLMWNAMRLLMGLDWTIVHAAFKQDYYNAIQSWRLERWHSMEYHCLQRDADLIKIRAQTDEESI